MSDKAMDFEDLPTHPNAPRKASSRGTKKSSKAKGKKSRRKRVAK